MKPNLSEEDARELVQLQIQSGAFSEAIQVLETFLEQHPEHLWGASELCRLFLHQRRWKEAGDLLESLHQKNPNLPEVLGLWGLYHHRQGELEDARTFYESSHTADPSITWISYNFARLAEATGDEEACERLLDNILASEPEYYPARYQRALLYGRTLRPAKMHEELRNTINSNPLMLQPYHVLAEIYLRGSNAIEAVNVLLHGIQANPLAHSLRDALARIYNLLGDAEAVFGIRLELCRIRGNFEDFLELGVAALQKDSMEHAVVAFTKAIQMRPKDWRGHYNLAEVHRHANDYRGALKHYENALGCQENSSVLNGFALWHLEAEEQDASAEQALRYLERALELEPSMELLRYNLLLAQLRLQRREAKGTFDSLQRLLSKDHPLRDELAKLQSQPLLA